MTGGLKHTADCASRKLMYGQMRYYNCDCGAKMTGEEIFRGMCSSFDKDGNSLPPAIKYKELSLEDKVTYLEWREDLLCEEFNEECREFARVIHPLRPHNDMKKFTRTMRHEACPTFYDGCNCEPDHTQTDYNDLKAENQRLKEDNADLFSGIMELEALKAVLVGAEYERVDELAKKGVEFCAAVGEATAKRTKALVKENSRLRELALIAWQVFGEQMKPSHREKFQKEFEAGYEN